MVAGVDEVGRGAWAGPVLAAAVVIPNLVLPTDIQAVLTDSKKLSPAQRNSLFYRLDSTILWSIGQASLAEIEQLNILQASLVAMARAIEGLGGKVDLALIDGNKRPAMALPCHTLIGGDRQSLSIAAASVMAKVTRDRLMAELAQDYPQYGWEKNAGYGTASHQKALDKFGVTALHRRGFRPIASRLKAGLK